MKIKRALLSVYDKTGIVELAQVLTAAGVELVSTGSTAKTIRDAGYPVTPVEQVTGFPECLDGRVKTLHPRIHAGILANRALSSHQQQLEELQISPFELVVCNLYPFAQTLASGAEYDQCIEQIDIGGPSMVRAAAKNHQSVAVIVDPSDYSLVGAALEKQGFTVQQRRQLAARAFEHTARYDQEISAWMREQVAGEGAAATNTITNPVVSDAESSQSTPTAIEQENNAISGSAPVPPVAEYQLLTTLRYGENPHQAAAVYTNQAETGGLAQAEQLGGKPMSFNNYTDADAAWRAAWDQPETCVAVIKHANPCGIAISRDGNVAAAHQAAHNCDPLSAFGGVIAVNRTVTVEMAQSIKPIFTEVVVAPDYQKAALEILRTKKNLRILRATALFPATELKPISGGALVQTRDQITAPGDYPENWRLVAGPIATPEILADLEFAWRSVRAVKSNAILLARNGATVGIGMGQVNRVDSCRLAVERANTLGPEGTLRATGAVAASDAFFPFCDGPEVLISAGVKAIVEPGGSIRDQETIEVCEQAGVSLYFTGVRHFAH